MLGQQSCRKEKCQCAKVKSANVKALGIFLAQDATLCRFSYEASLQAELLKEMLISFHIVTLSYNVMGDVNFLWCTLILFF